MRFKNMMVCVFVVAAVALTAGAEGIPEPNDFCDFGHIYISAEFFTVDCDDPANGGMYLVEVPDGACTGVQYTVDGNQARNLAQTAVLAYNPEYLDPETTDAFPKAGPSGSNDVRDRCQGDSANQLGINSCHEQAIRYNPDFVANNTFWFVVEGNRVPSATTLTIKTSTNKSAYCEILGVGDLMEENILPDGCVPSCGNFDEDQTITKTEILDFKGCKARFEYNLTTGSVLNFGAACDTELFPSVNPTTCCAENPNDPTCTPVADNPCDFPTYSAENQNVQVILDGAPALPVNFGDGLVSIGTESCSCRVIGGRIYCWGQTCPEYN